MSVQMLKGRVVALEQARYKNYDIHLENDVAITVAPPLPLVQAPLVHYAAALAKYMVHKRYESFLRELPSQNMRQQMQPDAQQQQFMEQQQRLAQSASRLSPFETAIVQALSSRAPTPATVTSLSQAWEGQMVTKERRTGAGLG